MNAVWNSYGQLCGCPEIFKKSCKFFCRELDIRVPQTMEHDLLKLRVLGSPQAVPFRQQLRCNGQAVRQPKQLPAVAVFLRGVLLVLLQLFKLCQQFFLYPMQTVMRLSRCGIDLAIKNRHTTT